jgi:hypothetical protein
VTGEPPRGDAHTPPQTRLCPLCADPHALIRHQAGALIPLCPTHLDTVVRSRVGALGTVAVVTDSDKGPSPQEPMPHAFATAMRMYDTGATRSSDSDRDDPEGYLSPLVIDRFNQYMSRHRIQANGTPRASDNWQRGMPKPAYMKGAWRHFLHWWTRHRGWPVRDPLAGANIEEDLCALLFNVQGYLHTLLVEAHGPKPRPGNPAAREQAPVDARSQPPCSCAYCVALRNSRMRGV